MLTGTLKGFLVLFIIVTLSAFPLALRMPVEDALQCCTRAIVAVSWLWLLAAPPTLLLAYLLRGRQR